jgi:transcriptional regulator with PAS, ATPase and Fis domain
LNALTKYYWPGNIRELENLIERLVVLSTSEEQIDLKEMPLEILTGPDSEIQNSDIKKSGLVRIRRVIEKRIVTNVLESTEWNQSEAAKILKVNRNTLIQKAKQLGILLKK